MSNAQYRLIIIGAVVLAIFVLIALGNHRSSESARPLPQQTPIPAAAVPVVETAAAAIVQPVPVATTAPSIPSVCIDDPQPITEQDDADADKSIAELLGDDDGKPSKPRRHKTLSLAQRKEIAVDTAGNECTDALSKAAFGDSLFASVADDRGTLHVAAELPADGFLTFKTGRAADIKRRLRSLIVTSLDARVPRFKRVELNVTMPRDNEYGKKVTSRVVHVEYSRASMEQVRSTDNPSAIYLFADAQDIDADFR